jgi:mycoredoxin-dependent peroxiredoxin
MIDVGGSAVDFTLKDQNNELFTLSAFRGDKAVLLVFYPFAFTGICTGELNALRDSAADFANDVVQAVTISCDSVYAHKVFAERERFAFPLLSDFWPHGEVARSHDSFSEEAGAALRGTFLVDREGVVRFVERNGLGRGRDPQAWRAAIAAL